MVSDRVDVADVMLWGHRIGAVAWDEDRRVASFEYDPAFQKSGVQLAPITMPLGPRIFAFPELAWQTYRGLPGLLADSLPDKFGNAVIDRWLAHEGRDRASFSPVERLCTIGQRGMGALEYRPALRRGERSEPIELWKLVELVREVLGERNALTGRLEGGGDESEEALESILRVGTSAGGARAKAVIAWNPGTDEIRSGQVLAPDGFEYWLLKFDGVANRDKELTDPKGHGKVEYAYHLMARAAGIEMSDCRLISENGRSHFMTRRFDRKPDGSKLHMQSLCAMAHLDYNMVGAHSYEQALSVIQELGMPMGSLAEQFRRMVFSVITRNQDDHTKNIAFLMDQDGRWTLSPAFDVTWAYNPDGDWTGSHQMTIHGKRDDLTREDLLAVAKRFRIPRARSILEEVRLAAGDWLGFAREAGVEREFALHIASTHRRMG